MMIGIRETMIDMNEEEVTAMEDNQHRPTWQKEDEDLHTMMTSKPIEMQTDKPQINPSMIEDRV
jgi:hypothetical protein